MLKNVDVILLSLIHWHPSRKHDLRNREHSQESAEIPSHLVAGDKSPRG